MLQSLVCIPLLGQTLTASGHHITLTTFNPRLLLTRVSTPLSTPVPHWPQRDGPCDHSGYTQSTAPAPPAWTISSRRSQSLQTIRGRLLGGTHEGEAASFSPVITPTGAPSPLWSSLSRRSAYRQNRATYPPRWNSSLSPGAWKSKPSYDSATNRLAPLRSPITGKAGRTLGAALVQQLHSHKSIDERGQLWMGLCTVLRSNVT